MATEYEVMLVATTSPLRSRMVPRGAGMGMPRSRFSSERAAYASPAITCVWKNAVSRTAMMKATRRARPASAAAVCRAGRASCRGAKVLDCERLHPRG
jgi:hypothetical protein